MVKAVVHDTKNLFIMLLKIKTLAKVNIFLKHYIFIETIFISIYGSFI